MTTTIVTSDKFDYCDKCDNCYKCDKFCIHVKIVTDHRGGFATSIKYLISLDLNISNVKLRMFIKSFILLLPSMIKNNCGMKLTCELVA